MKAIIILAILFISFFVFPLLTYSQFHLTPKDTYIFVTNNLIGDIHVVNDTLKLTLMNLSGYTINISLYPGGLLHLYSYSHSLLVFESNHVIPFLLAPSQNNSTSLYQRANQINIVYIINTQTMKYYNLTYQEPLYQVPFTDFDGIYKFNVTGETISNTTEETDGYTVTVPEVKITINTINLITNSTKTIIFTTTGLPLTFEKGNETFIGSSYVVMNPDNNYLYIITSTKKLQYLINIVNLTSGKITEIKLNFHGIIGKLLQQYLTFYNTYEVMLYNPIENVTITFPSPYEQLLIVTCYPSIPDYYPGVIYQERTTTTFPSLNETLLFFTNYGENISVLTIPTLLFCTVTVPHRLPPSSFLPSPNKINLGSVTVDVNGHRIHSVFNIYIFNSAVLFNSSYNYVTFNGNLTTGKVVSGVIASTNNSYYNYYNIKGVNQPIISNGYVITNSGSYPIPNGEYVVGVIGNHVILYGNGRINIVDDKNSGNQISELQTNKIDIGVLTLAGIGIAILIITTIIILGKRR